MNTYKFQASTSAGKWVFDALKESLAVIEDTTFSFGDPQEQGGAATCSISVSTEHSLSEVNHLLVGLGKVATEVGCELIIVHVPDHVDLKGGLVVVLKASDRKPLDELVEAYPLINTIISAFQVKPGEIGESPEGFYLVVDVAYDPEQTTEWFIEGYFKNCSEDYRINYEIYKGASIC